MAPFKMWRLFYKDIKNGGNVCVNIQPEKLTMVDIWDMIKKMPRKVAKKTKCNPCLLVM